MIIHSCVGYFDSNCNALCFTKDETTFCSGHDNGKIRFNNIWRPFTLSYGSEMAVHPLSLQFIRFKLGM